MAPFGIRDLKSGSPVAVFGSAWTCSEEGRKDLEAYMKRRRAELQKSPSGATDLREICRPICNVLQIVLQRMLDSPSRRCIMGKVFH